MVEEFDKKIGKSKISFKDTVQTTTTDVDVIASRIAVRKLLNLGWEVADLNNLVPFFSIRLVFGDIINRYAEIGPLNFLKGELKHMAYAMDKEDEIRRETYIGYDNVDTIAKKNKREEEERQRGECSRDEFEGDISTHVVYSNRQREAPRLMFFRFDYIGTDNPQLRVRNIELPYKLAKLILKVLPIKSKFVPIDYLVYSPPIHPLSFRQSINPEGFIFVELKTNKAKLSKKQLEISNMIQDAGYRVAELHASLNLGTNVEINLREIMK